MLLQYINKFCYNFGTIYSLLWQYFQTVKNRLRVKPPQVSGFCDKTISYDLNSNVLLVLVFSAIIGHCTQIIIPYYILLLPILNNI